MPQLTSDVFEGANGHLFLRSGRDDVASLISLPADEMARLVRQWVELICRRGRRLAQSGIVYRHCFVPDKLSVYREDAAELWHGETSPAERIEAMTSAELHKYLVPLTGFFRKQKQRYPIYFKTDTQWTIEGCFSAYQMLCASLQLPQRYEPRAEPTVEMYGDLGIRISPPRKEIFRYGSFGRAAVREYANDIVRMREAGRRRYDPLLRVGSMVRYRNERALSDKRIMIFGDQLSDHRLHHLTGLFADTVKEVTFVWSSDIDDALIAELAPDMVISEVAERFLARLPSDDIDLAATARKNATRALGAA